MIDLKDKATMIERFRRFGRMQGFVIMISCKFVFDDVLSKCAGSEGLGRMGKDWPSIVFLLSRVGREEW